MTIWMKDYNMHEYKFCRLPDRTPMHLAAERGHTAVVEFLADKFKASVFDRTKDGSTLMHIAALNGHPDTAMVLFKKGVPLLMPNKVCGVAVYMVRCSFKIPQHITEWRKRHSHGSHERSRVSYQHTVGQRRKCRRCNKRKKIY